MTSDCSALNNIHLIGIGGSGLSAIALYLHERGVTISGCDRVPSPAFQKLQQLGVAVSLGHDPTHVAGCEMVLRSSAIHDDHPEIREALARGIPVLNRARFLPLIVEPYDVIAVAGTHGKTTTSAMAAWVLSEAGKDPSYILGGEPKNFSGSGHAGQGHLFVMEADEYDGMFLGLQPWALILTNVDYDHPDCYPTHEDYRDAFRQFLRRLRPGGQLVVCADDPTALQLASEIRANRCITYGLDAPAEFSATLLEHNAYGGFTFTVVHSDPGGKKRQLGSVSLHIPGRHNVRNALGVIALATHLGIDTHTMASALESFSGVSRRFDILGEVQGLRIISDYGHHPTEIRTTLEAARDAFPTRRLIAVWQPHTYSRVIAFEHEFLEAFHQADALLITEVYAAREARTGFSVQDFAHRFQSPPAWFAPDFTAAAEQLAGFAQPGDVVIIFTAGDAEQIAGILANRLNGEVQRAS